MASLLRLRILKLLWLTKRPRWWRLLRFGIGPSIEHAESLSGHRFATVIDVGANVGQFTLWAQEALGPRRIICIEPQPEAAARVAGIADRAACAIDVLVCALGDEHAPTTLHVTAASDSSSLLMPDRAAVAEQPGLTVASTIEVPVVPGDEALAFADLERPVLLKIDVQGSEDRVLRGMSRALSRIDAVLVEVSFEQYYEQQAEASTVVEFLVNRGFRLSGVSKVPGVAGRWNLRQVDLLFERR